MSILCDTHILERIESESIGVSPPITEDQLQPGSLDIRLGDSYSNEYTGEIFENQDEIVIEPWTFYLGHTKDTISMPDDLSAMVSGRSSFGRKGLIIHSTAGWIDSGFNGSITLEMFNLSNEPIVLEPGVRIGQVVFFEMSSASDVPYNEKEDAKYNNQEGPTQSRVD